MSTPQYPVFEGMDLSSMENELLTYWEDYEIFKKSIEQRPEDKTYVFYEGPPSANGRPGIHHVISRTIKDLICRYQTMRGHRVVRKAGWDTHGLPVELNVEKQLGITKKDIGVKITEEEYNAKCRKEVLKYKDEWDEITRRMGYWVNMQTPYITFENPYIETLWWVLGQLYQKEYLYKSISIQPYSPAAGTGLSSHELNQPGTYQDVTDTSVTALFRLDKEKSRSHSSLAKLSSAAQQRPIYFMAWTTTPWTLPSNTGLSLGAKIEYVLVHTLNPYTHLEQDMLIAKALLGKYFDPEFENKEIAPSEADGQKVPWQISEHFLGTELEGLYYDQLIDYVQPEEGDPFRTILADFVTTEDGTGIVHTAPAFGADDYKVGLANNLGMLLLVDKEGKFIDGVGELSGKYVKNYKDDPDYEDVNVEIAVKLKKESSAFKVEKYAHNYPHCWRTDKPIIYYPLDAWFVKTTAVKDRLIELNKTINWKPKSTGEGRFGNWLENMVDWNLSRSRYWGTPLPIWTDEDQTEFLCISSLDELAEKYNEAKAKGYNANSDFQTIEGKLDVDLHKPYVDDIELLSDSGRVLRRVPDLVDVWFDSGSMPYAQWHYPFENVEQFKRNFPADFIAEGVDQTRGWFYTLHVLGVMLMDSVAYKNVISNGLVLDKDGEKMSKRKGNVVNPFETIEKYSADATRWYLVTNAAPWESNKFNIDGLEEVRRKFFGTYYNTYQFFVMYANLDKFAFEEETIPLQDRPELDQWILSALQSCTEQVIGHLENYDPTKAFKSIEYFLDTQLSNWYVRLNRRRFWKGEYEKDKISAYQSLYLCLEQMSLLMAPLAPFISDRIYQNLNGITHRHTHSSVHLCDFPVVDKEIKNTDLEERMQLAMDISSLVLSIRKKEKIKVRQPLQKILLPVLDKHMQEQVEAVEDIILSEVNIKEIEYIYETAGVISKKVKPDFKKLGARLGKNMKEVNQSLSAMDQSQIQELEANGSMELELSSGETVQIALDEVVISAQDIPGWKVASNGKITLALDVQISEELEQEGIAREIVNRVQNLRKDNDMEITDRIILEVNAPEKTQNSLKNYKSYICAEILADDIINNSNLKELSLLQDINGEDAYLYIKKVN